MPKKNKKFNAIDLNLLSTTIRILVKIMLPLVTEMFHFTKYIKTF